MICIGIDPGTHTGMAVWDTREGKFLSLETLPIHQAMRKVEWWQNVCRATEAEMVVVFEDARQRNWFGKGDVSAKMQGAGSIKRDCTIWEDFCKDCGISFQARHPIKGATKMSSEFFKIVTKWQGRTSEHSRDAAMLVIGR